MSDLGDHGIAASIGAFVVAGIATAREFFTRRKRRGDVPELVDPETTMPSSTLAARVGRLYDRLTLLEQDMSKLSQTITTKLDKLDESVDELHRSRVRTDEMLPLIKDQLKEIRDELHQQRRATTNRE